MSGQVDNNLRNAYLLHLNGTALTFPDVENIELELALILCPLRHHPKAHVDRSKSETAQIAASKQAVNGQ
uniref:Transposase n=1 Tax=Ascaris lumbricoides TaxID=6252 RepID=A0A0M3HX93_ASCLU